MAVCWCGREHKPDTAIGAAHAHREHPAMFLAYPFQPRCRCGWHGHVFYKDAYHALGHWVEHAESALTEGAHRDALERREGGTSKPHPAPSVSALMEGGGRGTSKGNPATVLAARGLDSPLSVSALTEGEHRSTSRARATDAGPATGTVTTRPAPSVSALNAPAAPRQKQGSSSNLSSCPADCSRQSGKGASRAPWRRER